MSDSSPDMGLAAPQATQRSDDAAAEPSPVLGATSGRPAAAAAPRSCDMCKLRKVRCDRKMPCSRCVGNGKSCVYPPAGPRVRRTKKTIMADMASRLSSLEKSVETAASIARGSVKVESLGERRSGTPSRVVKGAEPASARSREDILVQRGSASQYFNDILLSREQHIESALTSPQATPEQNSEVPSPFDVMGILSAPDPSRPAHAFHPAKTVALRLWEVYARNEDSSVCYKVLHHPTAEVTVHSVLNNPAGAPHDGLALCYAMYFSATVYLQQVEGGERLSPEWYAQLQGFKVGLEQAFAQGNFLDCPTVLGLQALIIYLLAIRMFNRGKGTWIINGLAWRIAQSLGLHRDGQSLGLPPFESELRRRVWWLLIVSDGRAGEDFGMPGCTPGSPGSSSSVSEVRRPLNIEDTDLYPGMRELPAAREGWTPMTFLVLYIDICESMRELEASVSSSPAEASEETRQRIMAGLWERSEAQYARCNTVVPRQLFTVLCGRFVLRKLDFMTRQRWFMLRHPGQHDRFATDENLRRALEVVEAVRFSEDNALLGQYDWCRRAYPQYHLALYLLWHLCVRPEGEGVERAWRAVDSVFETMEHGRGVGAKWIVLKELRAKAEAARRKAEGRHTEDDERRMERRRDGEEVMYESQGQVPCQPDQSNGHSGQAVMPDNGMLGMFHMGNPAEDWVDYSMLGFELHDWTTWVIPT